MNRIGSRTKIPLMKKLFLSAVLGLWSVHAALAQVTPMPAKVSSGITQAPTTKSDLLDTLSERIGDGRAYRLTRKGVDPIVCTLQGRTDTSLIVSQCHFHIVKATLNAKTHQVEAPPWAVPPVFYTELSDEEALKMLETEPRRFTGDIHYGQRGIFATHFVLNWPCQIYHVGDSIKIAKSDVTQVEYINLPASALPADLPPESPMPSPNRVNPSVFSVWPPTEQPSGISKFQRKRQ